MSMSTHIIGFKAPDDKWIAMKSAWDACEKAELSIPEGVLKYFDGEKPDPRGVEVKLELKGWHDNYREGFEIEVKTLPKDITHIRFYNSY